MKYFQGFVIPVKTKDKPAYFDMVKEAAPIFAEYGAAVDKVMADDRMKPDGPMPFDGKLTDFKRAVQSKDGERKIDIAAIERARADKPVA